MDRKALSLRVGSVEQDADHVYVNLFIPNDNPTTAQPRNALEAKAKATISETVIDNPSDYYLSIVRFSCPLTQIPIAVMGIQVQTPLIPAPNINLTPYSVSIQSPGDPVRQTFLIWTPEDLSAPVPALDPIRAEFKCNTVNLSFVLTSVNPFPPIIELGYGLSGTNIPPGTTVAAFNAAARTITMSAAATGDAGPPSANPPIVATLLGSGILPRFGGRHAQFYGTFSYQHFVDMINTALATSFAAASADPGWPAAATLAPWFSFDPVTQQCSLSAQSAYATATPSSAGIQIFFNSELMEFFQGTFQTIYNGFQGVPPAPATGTDYLMLIKDNGFNRLVNVPNNPPPAAASAGLEMKQEFAAVVFWTDFVGLQVQTGLIPVEPEYAGIIASNASDSKRPILTDFFPQSSGSGVDLRTFLNYVPSGEYRLVDLVGNSPLNLLDIQVRWVDDLGSVNPVYVTHNTACSAKLMFRRKTFNKGARGAESCAKCASGGCMSCGGGKISRRR